VVSRSRIPLTSITILHLLICSPFRDWQKLIFYYYADHYVNFKDLVNDLYKLYKVRLWMSAVNPASFSTNAINQPPTGIGHHGLRH
jgi:hypothetical protein